MQTRPSPCWPSANRLRAGSIRSGLAPAARPVRKTAFGLRPLLQRLKQGREHQLLPAHLQINQPKFDRDDQQQQGVDIDLHAFASFPDRNVNVQVRRLLTRTGPIH
jgi:hypothetical protein